MQGIPTELQLLLLSYERRMKATRRPSDSLILDVFVQLLSLIRLIGNNTSLNLLSRFLLKSYNTESLSNRIRHRAWMKTGFFFVFGGMNVFHSAFPKIVCARHYLHRKHCILVAFIQLVEKWKYDPSDFSPLNRGEPIHQNGLCQPSDTKCSWIVYFDIFNTFANLRVVQYE